MHELSIAHGLVETAVTAARRHGASKVARLQMVIGSLSGVEPEALATCFPMAARGTVCEGAVLDITRVEARGVCPACKKDTVVQELMDPCPFCGHWPLTVTGGREMTLSSLEVD